MVSEDSSNGRKICPCTWWEDPTEFNLVHDDRYVKTAEVLNLDDRKDQHRFLKNILESRPYIIIYHKAGLSKLKHCSDVDHFHMITWHVNHPTSEHSFMGLKRTVAKRGIHPYEISCPKVYNPYGLTILRKKPERREVIVANRLTTEGQKAFFTKVTDKTIPIRQEEVNYTDMSTKQDTIRGQKYDFIAKMKRCNSTDIDIMIYCKNTKNEKIRNTWEHIFRNTTQLNNIVQAAGTDIHVETKVQPVWEQIQQKNEYFELNRNRYWDVQTSLNIYKKWCEHHGIDSDDFERKTFEVCHKIRPKINGLHITGVSNSGKSYVLRSIRNGLMNCGRMHCQASDNFTFGSCVDKTLINMDEMWFTPQNVEEGKCILEGTETYVNVKHQNERLLRRTPSLSTSNDGRSRHNE